jgi:hypothetical protein
MKKYTTGNSIPPITEGFKLKFDGTDTEYFISPNKNIWVSKNFKQHMHPNAPLLKDVIWKLEPICDSGLWISGEYPLPHPQEGTLLVLSHWHDGPCYCVAEVIDRKWCIVGTETLELKEWGQFNNWMWVSVPK